MRWVSLWDDVSTVCFESCYITMHKIPLPTYLPCAKRIHHTRTHELPRAKWLTVPQKSFFQFSSSDRLWRFINGGLVLRCCIIAYWRLFIAKEQLLSIRNALVLLAEGWVLMASSVDICDWVWTYWWTFALFLTIIPTLLTYIYHHDNGTSKE